MPIKSLAEEFAQYVKAVYPGGLNPASEQFKQVQLAFYGGITALMGQLRIISEDSVSEDAGVQHLEGVHRELDQHAAQVAMQAAQGAIIDRIFQARRRRDN